MAFIPVPDTAMLELVYAYQGSIMENVLYYSGLNVDDAGVLQGLCEDALTQWQATWMACQCDSLYLSWIKATDLTQEDGAVYEFIPQTAQHGTAASQGLPANCAMLLSIKTAKRGKSFRGRLYVPGLTEGGCDGSTITSAIQTPMTASFDYWDFLDVNGEPYALQVVSRYHNGQPRTVGVHTDVTGWVCKATVASQRRRLPGRGT